MNTLEILREHIPEFGKVIKGFKITEDGTHYLNEAMKILPALAAYPTITELMLLPLPNRPQKKKDLTLDLGMITAQFPELEYLNLWYYGEHHGSLGLEKLKRLELRRLIGNVVSDLIPKESSQTLEKASFTSPYNVFEAHQFTSLHPFKNLKTLDLSPVPVEEAQAIFKNASHASYSLEHLEICLTLGPNKYDQDLFSLSLKQLQTLNLTCMAKNDEDRYEAGNAIVDQVTSSLLLLEKLIVRVGWCIGWLAYFLRLKEMSTVVWNVGRIAKEDEAELKRSIDLLPLPRPRIILPNTNSFY